MGVSVYVCVWPWRYLVFFANLLFFFAFQTYLNAKIENNNIYPQLKRAKKQHTHKHRVGIRGGAKQCTKNEL